MTKFDLKTNCYTLASGRTVYAYGGVLGLGQDAIAVLYGWDGGVEDADWGVDEGDHMHDGAPFTEAERQEIATEMIRRWEWWRDHPPTFLDRQT